MGTVKRHLLQVGDAMHMIRQAFYFQNLCACSFRTYWKRRSSGAGGARTMKHVLEL